MLETLGHYRILDRIGAGGIGDVYRARDTRVGRTVALKVISAALLADPGRRERFVREARAAAALSHPNIAALYEIGADQGVDFLAFEFVPGESLKSIVAGRPLNPRQAIDFAVQLADALAEAHAAGVVHRDVKPDNVFVTPKGHAKLLDLGLAAWTGGGAARERTARAAATAAPVAGDVIVQTARYMSPEQVLGGPDDCRTDIFSLGAVIFEMLTGRPLFAADTPAALALQIAQAPAPAPSAINPRLPQELDPIVVRALAKGLDERYQSAATLAAELRSVAAILDVRSGMSEPPVVAADTPSRRVGRGWVVGLLIAVAIAGLVWLALRA